MVDPKYPVELSEKAGKLVLKREAEEYLVKLLELQNIVNEAVGHVKESIKQAGETIDPSFKGVIGERVKAIYRSYGAKYTYKMSEIEIAKPFLKEKIYYSVDSSKVDKYVKEVGEMPDGIHEKDRTKSISFSLNNKFLEE